ncbi:MAG TPA: hypothetical protein VL242_03445 [Sorangium sp.]|nr:hypothetical protein [Sorangium sp.]
MIFPPYRLHVNPLWANDSTTRRPRALLPCGVVLVAFEADRQSAPSRPEELPWVDAYRTFATDRVRPVEMTARDGGRGTVPMAVAVSLTQDVAVRRLAGRDHHIVRWTELARGGLRGRAFAVLRGLDAPDLRGFSRAARLPRAVARAPVLRPRGG